MAGLLMFAVGSLNAVSPVRPGLADPAGRQRESLADCGAHRGGSRVHCFRRRQKIESAANAVGSKTMSLQYLDALGTLGDGPATKFVLPMEFLTLLRPLIVHAERAVGPKP